MFSRIRSKLTYANVVASLALFFALAGGAAYAQEELNVSFDLKPHSVGSIHLKKNSVGTKTLRNGAVTRKKIKNNAVDSQKVENGSLLAQDFAANQIPAGPQGPAGPAGASALDPVPSGRTIRGAVGGDFHAFDASASDFGVDVTLPVPAANGLADGDVFVNVAGWQDGGGQTQPTTTDTDPGCTGTPAAPTAPAGKVCIYVSGADHAFNLEGFSVLFGTGASPYGFKLKWDASQAGDTFVDATWAYTAP